MHGDLVLSDWFVWLVYGLTLVLLIGAVALIVSAFRRPAGDFGRLGRWPWVAVQGLFLVMSTFAIVANLLEFGSAVPLWFTGGLGVAIVLAAIQQVAYLLRVVYPSPRRAGRDRSPEE